MRAPVLFLLAILTPIMLCATLFVPLYASVYGAAYVIYDSTGGAHPLADKWLDVPFMIDTYGSLFDYWSSNDGLSFVDYTLPIIGLPLFGLLLSLFLTYRLSRTLFNWFHLSANHN